MQRRITRRRFLELSCTSAAGLAAGCSTTGNYSSSRNAGTTGAGSPSDLDRLNDYVVSGGPGKDGIPPIDNPKFVSASEMDDVLKPNDMVFVLDHKGELKVYPQIVLVWHEIVNDEVAGEKLSVTYCPLTGSTVAFKGNSPGGEPLTFGTTGRLVNSNLLMYDRATDSEWPQILGRAINGTLQGSGLEEIPLIWTTWELWREQGERDAPVLSTDTGHIRQYGSDPYGSYSAPEKGYYQSSGTLFSVVNESDLLHAKEVVLGVKDGESRHAIPKKTALEKGIWNLKLGDRSVVAVADTALETVRVFDRRLDGEMLEFRRGEGASVEDGSGRIWNRKGLTLSGPGGAILPAARFYEVMWFAWYAFFPQTKLVT